MDLKLRGKTAIVSGSTAGIGFAIAQGLAEEGAHVYVNGRTQGRVEAAVDTIRTAAPEAEVEGIAADLATDKGAQGLFAKLPQVDILINNLGIFEPKAFVDIPDEDWRRFFEVNVLSGVRLSRHYLPRMVKKGWGRIIFVSSESAVQVPPEMIHYGMTKTAQLAISRGLAESVAGTGVTVNSILPGPTASEGVTTYVGEMAKQQKVSAKIVEQEFFRNVRPTSLLQRFATSEEVANLAVYVASERSVATNGAALRVDGGVIRAVI